MTRRLVCRGLILGTFVLGSTGCEELHKMLRHDDSSEKKSDDSKPGAVTSDGRKILGVDSDEKSAEPFFKSNRRTGGWSSEAREIENSLGVN